MFVYIMYIWWSIHQSVYVVTICKYIVCRESITEPGCVSVRLGMGQDQLLFEAVDAWIIVYVPQFVTLKGRLWLLDPGIGHL